MAERRWIYINTWHCIDVSMYMNIYHVIGFFTYHYVSYLNLAIQFHRLFFPKIIEISSHLYSFHKTYTLPHNHLKYLIISWPRYFVSVPLPYPWLNNVSANEKKTVTRLTSSGLRLSIKIRSYDYRESYYEGEMVIYVPLLLMVNYSHIEIGPASNVWLTVLGVMHALICLDVFVSHERL